MKPTLVAGVLTVTIAVVLMAVVVDLVFASEESEDPIVAVAALIFLAVIGGFLAYGLARWLNNSGGAGGADGGDGRGS